MEDSLERLMGDEEGNGWILVWQDRRIIFRKITLNLLERKSVQKNRNILVD